MGRGIESLDKAYGILLTTVLVVLALLVILCLVRAIIGPRVADRIVSVNMMGTMVIVIIAVLALLLGEGYLIDICIIYAMISFLAVIVLTKVYMGVYLEKKQAEAGKESGTVGTMEMPGRGKSMEASETPDKGKGMEESEMPGRGKSMEASEMPDKGKSAEELKPSGRNEFMGEGKGSQENMGNLQDSGWEEEK